VETGNFRPRIPALLFLFIVLLVIGLILGLRSPGDFFGHKPPWAEALAVVVVFGFVVAAWARTVLGRNWSYGTAFKEHHELVERGPYRYVRHPIYSGMLLMLAGLVIRLTDVASIIILLAILVSFLIRIQQEEALLTRHFPVAYPAYKRRTKKLIPLVF
jgi:protein-S-isoprenylcysteine O-methyltransferase Ste14